jgi:hypothetical protein
MNWFLKKLKLRKAERFCDKCDGKPKVRGYRFCRPCMDALRSARLRRVR